MTLQIPARPSLEQLRKQAKTLLAGHRSTDAAALARIRASHPRWQHLSDTEIARTRFTLADAQRVLAHEYGFRSWSAFKDHVEASRADSSMATTVEAVRAAAGKGDVACLAALLDAHPGLIDEPGGPGVRTALHQAVFGNSEAAVKLLLERGANPNIRCEGDNAYPLHFAVEKNRVPIIHLLVEHGADTVGEGDYHELGVLGWACAWESIQGDPETAAYLLAHGATHNIFSAVAMGDPQAIRELVQRTPGDLQKRMNGTKMRRMPLHLAVWKRQMGSLATLLDLGAGTEPLDEAGMTPLDYAAFLGEAAMVEALLERGAKVRLPAAIALHRADDAERLLRRDPGALKPGGRWGYLVVRAAECASGEVVDALIAAGADVNMRDDPKTAIDSTSGFTPLHAAAWHNNLGAIEVLMRHGANVRVREEKYHGTPAGWADYAGHKEARDIILTGPIDIIEAIQYDLPGRVAIILEEEPAALDRPFRDYGLYPYDAEPWHTPLAYAVARGRAGIVRLLLDRGADTSVRSPAGKTLAESAADPEIAALLT